MWRNKGVILQQVVHVYQLTIALKYAYLCKSTMYIGTQQYNTFSYLEILTFKIRVKYYM